MARDHCTLTLFLTALLLLLALVACGTPTVVPTATAVSTPEPTATPTPVPTAIPEPLMWERFTGEDVITAVKTVGIKTTSGVMIGDEAISPLYENPSIVLRCQEDDRVDRFDALIDWGGRFVAGEEWQGEKFIRIEYRVDDSGRLTVVGKPVPSNRWSVVSSHPDTMFDSMSEDGQDRGFRATPVGL